LTAVHIVVRPAQNKSEESIAGNDALDHDGDSEPVRSFPRRVAKSVLRSSLFQALASRLVYGALWLVYRTNPAVASSHDISGIDSGGPVIIALWHGQQALVPFARPDGARVAALVSRSADAELNARVLALAGTEIIRGSGGRDREAGARKGGAKALLSMRRALNDNQSVVMIADISKQAPREAGAGIIALARISGRPIVPVALATSRYHVVEKAWDRMTINLPFGRRCLRVGAPIHVAADAGAEEVELARSRLTRELDAVTRAAYAAAEVGR
jgi:lysophospholipid acyltransferase (LPLAT)-like uncharacterized protein